MPNYTKFPKEILSNKRRINEDMVRLTDRYSTIIPNKLPPKLKVPWSFTMPCTIGNLYFGKALCKQKAVVEDVQI